MDPPWLDSSVGQSFIPILQGCRFDPWSGHTQKSTNEYINEQNNNSMFLSFSFPLSLKSINKNNFF